MMLPIAASQSLNSFEPVYLVNGQVTRWLAASAHGTASQPFFGWVAVQTYKTVNGVSTPFAAGVLVDVIPALSDVLWSLPTYGQAPTVANVASGANTTGFQVYNNAGQYVADLTQTANPVVRPLMFDLQDELSRAGGAYIYKAAPAVGDRFICSILPAGKQVTF